MPMHRISFEKESVVTCIVCGVVFVSRRRQRAQAFRKTCSTACRNALALETMRIANTLPHFDRTRLQTCLACGKEFLAQRSSSHVAWQSFCSVPCSARYRGQQAKGKPRVLREVLTLTCPVCQTIFTAKRTGHGEKRHCSIKCARMAERTRVERTCQMCGKVFLVAHEVTTRSENAGTLCSRTCLNAWRRQHAVYRDKAIGPRPTGDGYVEEYCPDHPSVQGRQNKRVLQHRLVMEQMLGRFLVEGENVHHRDGQRNNNAPGNLELWVRVQPAGARVDEIYGHDVNRLLQNVVALEQENATLKQRLALLEVAQA